MNKMEKENEFVVVTMKKEFSKDDKGKFMKMNGAFEVRRFVVPIGIALSGFCHMAELKEKLEKRNKKRKQ